MGDIIGAIFGTSSTQTQKTVPDAVTRALNTLRLQQASNLFSVDDLWRYANYNPEGVSARTEDTSRVTWTALERYRPVDYSNLLSLDQYRQSFDPVTGTYRGGLQDIERLRDEGLRGNQGNYNDVRQNLLSSLDAARGGLQRDYTTGTGAAEAAYGRVGADITADYNAAIARGDYDYARALIQSEVNRSQALAQSGNTGLEALLQSEVNRSRGLGQAQSDLASSIGLQELGRTRALDLGTRATGGYIDTIATPRINQALALQGLESGGAVPAAIARATAETAIPFLQAIEQLYGSNVAQLLAQYMQQTGAIGTNTQNVQAGIGTNTQNVQAGINTNTQNVQAQLGGAQAAQNAQLGGQLMSLQGAAGGTYQQNVAQLAQALMNNNITLEQAGIAADSALGQQLIAAQNQLRQQVVQGNVALTSMYTPLQAAFAGSLPQASAQLSLLPQQLTAASTANATALQPLADFSRQLRESDLLIRQGLLTSVYTGIPFSPGSTTSGKSGTGNIFDQLGGTISSGVTGGEGGFSTLGTKT